MLALAALAALAADPCAGALPPDAFGPRMGALVTAAGPCALVVETRPSPSLFSWGGAQLDHEIAPEELSRHIASPVHAGGRQFAGGIYLDTGLALRVSC